jgi:uncharacterized membrane protein HdeD (DUF308 family)
MTPFIKKVGGLGLVLLGGLTTADGGTNGQTTDILIGLALMIIGVALLVVKIADRTTPVDSHE